MARSFILPTRFTARDELSGAISKMQGKMQSFGKAGELAMARIERGARSVSNKFSEIAGKSKQIANNTAIAGAALAAPLVVAANAAIQYEDRMADVAKTTGLAGAEMAQFSKELLEMAPSTRTSIEGLQKIATIGGQMGIAKGEIMDFTKSVDKFNVALGTDFGGGVEEAARAIGSLNTLFKETRGLKVADSITKVGSAINALSAQGVQVPELTEFIKRIGQLPDAIKPSIQDTAALGAVMNKSGITAEISARAIGDLIGTASKAKYLGKFAAQLHISEKSMRDLINTNPTEFLKQFGKSLNGLKATEISDLLTKLGVEESGNKKAIGSLAANLDMLTKFQKISNSEYIKGTSILNEYNLKNETTAAKMERAKNNFEAFSILIGTQMLPVINKLIEKVAPFIAKLVKWVVANKELVKYILIGTAALAAFLFVVSGISFVIAGVTSAIAFLSGAVSFLAAVFGFIISPIGILIASFIALVYLVYVIVKHWNEWGASITLVGGVFAAFLSPFLAGIALIISMVMSFSNNWDNIIKAFSENGIVSGILMIGNTIMDAILYPLQQVLEIAGKLTGIEMFTNAAKGLKGFRSDMGINVTSQQEKILEAQQKQEGVMSSGQGMGAEPVNPKLEAQDGLMSTMQTIQKQNVTIDIRDKTGAATVKSDANYIPIKLTSTMQR